MLQFPQPPLTHTTYAVFSVPSAQIPGGGVHIVEVGKERDIAALDIPVDAFRVYFCDALPRDQAEDGDILRYETNLSPYIYIAREVISGDEMRQRLLDKGVIKSLNPIHPTRDENGNLTGNVVRHAVWLTKSRSADWHAVGRGGEYLPIYAGHNITVIDADKNILMDAHEIKPRTKEAPPQIAAKLRIKRPPDNRFKL